MRCGVKLRILDVVGKECVVCAIGDSMVGPQAYVWDVVRPFRKCQLCTENLKSQYSDIFCNR